MSVARVVVCAAFSFSVGGNYDGFIEDILPPVLELFGSARMRAYVDAAMGYFTSQWTVIKQNAAFLTVCLCPASLRELSLHLSLVCARALSSSFLARRTASASTPPWW